MQFSITGEFANLAQAREPAGKTHKGDSNTATPIKHVVVIVGENGSFDHLFATYVPTSGEAVNNLLSEQIINLNGLPRPNYSRAAQYSADVTGNPTYQPSPTTDKTPYATLPAPLNGGPSNVCVDNGMCNLGDAVSSEDGLPKPPFTYYQSLLVGGSGLTGKVPDSRIVSTRCGSRRTAALPTPVRQIPAAAWQTCLLGPK